VLLVLHTQTPRCRLQVGFLEDWRRLNVAITRPRRGLVLFGHAATLAAGGETWGSYIGWLQQQGCVVAAGQLRQQLAALAAVQ
jgi:superfamily I DNA and/or RNA helicase